MSNLLVDLLLLDNPIPLLIIPFGHPHPQSIKPKPVLPLLIQLHNTQYKIVRIHRLVEFQGWVQFDEFRWSLVSDRCHCQGVRQEGLG